jgi:CHASE3 domain sensor protein
VSTAPDKGDGVALLLDEVRDEARMLIAHPIDEVKRLEHVAADGESAATPLILVTGIGLVLTVVVVVTSALALVLYYTV